MIRIENVTKGFPGVKELAVNNLNLEVNEGEVCVLVGPSGCGKTTTMKMINRLYEPDSGTIYIDGKDISQTNPIKLRQNIGYVIQDTGLFPHFTIEENIATVPREKRWPEEKIRQRTREMMKLIGLDPEIYGQRYPSALSGGQQQRVGVARALASDPPILLMDEPFAAVDPITRARLQNEFLRILQRLNKTIVFVTHDIDEAIKMADRIAVMRKGVLVQYATPDELLSSPADDFVARLVGKNRSIKRLHLMKVGQMVNGGHETVNLGSPLKDVASKMKTSPIRAVMVVDEANKLRGIIGPRDLERKTGQVAQDIAQEVPETVTTDATLNDALSVMLEVGEGYVTVVDENGAYQGVITLGDLLQGVKDDEEIAS